MSAFDRVRDRVPIEGGHGTRSRADGSTVSGTQSDTVGHGHDSIEEELDRRFAEQIEEARKRIQGKAEFRSQRKRARDYGLTERHENKLRRINESAR